MNIMSGSVKSDGGGKNNFCDMGDLCHSRRGNFYELTWPTPPYPLLFHANFYLFIG